MCCRKKKRFKKIHYIAGKYPPMKSHICLLLLGCILLVSCASQEKGCPSSNYYTKEIKTHNRKAGKQMGRLF